VIAGDVEFHAITSDWYRHGHHRDLRYNRVILHVVWTDDIGITEREDGSNVPILALQSSVSSSVLSRHQPPDSLLPHPCIASFANLSTATLRAAVRQLGVARLQEKADRFSSDMAVQSADQVLYGALFEALGYASNRDVFRRLADALPYAWLASLDPADWAPVLLDAAGLGPPCGLPVPARLSESSWRLARIRPTNHPVRRLRGVAALLQSFVPSPADAAVRIVTESRRPADLRRALMTQDGLIGSGRADEIAISVVLPFVAARVPSLHLADGLFLSFPAAPSNRWTRAVWRMLAEAGHDLVPKNAAEHQGMHHLYHRHCRHERHRGCAICAGALATPEHQVATRRS
jgi:hypothetical protein